MSEKENVNSDEEDKDELLAKLEFIGDGGWFLWKIFFLCLVPTILNGIQVTSYVYLAEVPEHWCLPPEFSASRWTERQMREISSPTGSNESSCEYYDWDYAAMLKLNFNEAFDYVKTLKKPKLSACKRFGYAEGSSSIVADQYDLICNRTPLKSMIQVSLSLGKFLGGLFFGVLSDRYGRKLSFLLGCFFYIASGPLVAFARDYWMIVVGRIGLGAAGVGLYTSSFIIVSETASQKRRTLMGILYNMSYPLGQMIIPLLAYFVRDWRNLQMTISAPSIFLLVFYWFLPESPRWLILNNRRAEASRIIDKVYWKRRKVAGEECETKAMNKADVSPAAEKLEPAFSGSSSEGREIGQNEERGKFIWMKKFFLVFNQLGELFRHSEVRWRLLITFFVWAVCSMSYYVIALNVDNFLADRYLYGFVSGLVELPSYVLPLPMLKYLGRRSTSIILLYIGGFALLVILAISREEELAVLVIASIGRLCISAVFAVVTLHTTELFPTLLRNTAMGCCSTACHIGSMSSPLIVDILGAYAWFLPSTVCGVSTLIGGTLIFLLPETKNKPLPDKTEDVTKASLSDKVGFQQICST